MSRMRTTSTHRLGHLLLQQAVHGRPAGAAVFEFAVGSAGRPPVRPDRFHLREALPNAADALPPAASARALARPRAQCRRDRALEGERPPGNMLSSPDSCAAKAKIARVGVPLDDLRRDGVPWPTRASRWLDDWVAAISAPSDRQRERGRLYPAPQNTPLEPLRRAPLVPYEGTRHFADAARQRGRAPARSGVPVSGRRP